MHQRGHSTTSDVVILPCQKKDNPYSHLRKHQKYPNKDGGTSYGPPKMTTS